MTATYCPCSEQCELGYDDHFQPATRELMVFTKSAKRYFDLDSVREPLTGRAEREVERGGIRTGESYHHDAEVTGYPTWRGTGDRVRLPADGGGAPPLDWWQIPSPKPQTITPYEGPPMSATMYIGDVLDVLAKLPENSVDLVLSSPPFLALRSYLPADHPLKEKEGGSQSTPGEYIDWLLDVVEACDRVLAPHGSLCFELGDTYAGSVLGFTPSDASEGYDTPGRQRPAQHPNASKNGRGWPLPKSLSLIPESFRFAMVYGFNPFTGRQTERWRLRNVIRWVRPNPPVGALGDKFRPATSELMVFCKSAKRYFDLDAVREPAKGGEIDTARRAHAVGADGFGQPPRWTGTTATEEGHRINSNPAGAPPLDWWNIPLLEGEEPTKMGPKDTRPKEGIPNGPKALTPSEDHHRGTYGFTERTTNPLGSPPLDWWNIPPGGYEGAHYSVWPPELLIKPIKAMCPEQVCRTCGEARRRIVDVSYERNHDGGSTGTQRDAARPLGDITSPNAIRGKPVMHKLVDTVGLTDCGHNDYRNGVVLDPFVGSGTTLAVATGHGRDAIGVDLDLRNWDLALERVGPLVLQRGEVAA